MVGCSGSGSGGSRRFEASYGLECAGLLPGRVALWGRAEALRVRAHEGHRTIPIGLAVYSCHVISFWNICSHPAHLTTNLFFNVYYFMTYMSLNMADPSKQIPPNQTRQQDQGRCSSLLLQEQSAHVPDAYSLFISGELTDWPVDIDEQTRLVSSVHARDCNLRAGRSGTTAGNSDLRAGDVELGTAESRRAVDGNMFHADQVVSRRKGLGDGEGELARSCGNPHSALIHIRRGQMELTDIERNGRGSD